MDVEVLEAALGTLAVKAPLKLQPIVADRILGLKYLYTPVSDEEIARYTEEEYPRWIKECEDYLSCLHDSLQSESVHPCFSFPVVNEGNRPGHDALINLIAEGELRICPPPVQHEAEEEDGKIDSLVKSLCRSN